MTHAQAQELYAFSGKEPRYNIVANKHKHIMTIDELIERLEEAKEEMSGHAEVRFASQPSWPFEYSITEVYQMSKKERKETAIEGMREDGMSEEEITENLEDYPLHYEEDVVYLEEGGQIGYLPDDAREMIGW